MLKDGVVMSTKLPGYMHELTPEQKKKLDEDFVKALKVADTRIRSVDPVLARMWYITGRLASAGNFRKAYADIERAWVKVEALQDEVGKSAALAMKGLADELAKTKAELILAQKEVERLKHLTKASAKRGGPFDWAVSNTSDSYRRDHD